MLTIRYFLLLIMLIFLSACSTTSSTFSEPYSTPVDRDGDGYDREKAASTRLDLSMGYLAQGDFEKAKFHLDKANKHLPGSENVMRAYGWYYERVSETELAEMYYKKALKVNNKNPELLNQYGVFLCRNNKLPESLKMFEASVKLLSNKDVSGTYENAATCNLMAGNKEQAEIFYLKALNHNPRQHFSILGMAELEFAKERYSRAQSYIARFERVARTNPRALWLALRTESKLGNMDAVASYGIKLEQLFPDSKQTIDYLNTKNQWLN